MFGTPPTTHSIFLEQQWCNKGSTCYNSAEYNGNKHQHLQQLYITAVGFTKLLHEEQEK
jgi:hypothetical protein